MIEQKEDRGVQIKLIDLLAMYLLKDSVSIISNSDTEIYYALRCSFCGRNHIVDEHSEFECHCCGSTDYEKVE